VSVLVDTDLMYSTNQISYLCESFLTFLGAVFDILEGTT